MSGVRAAGGILLLGAILAVAVALRLLLVRPLGGGASFAWPEGVILELRLGAVAAAVVVGASLAISGTMLQALLRNPLADPFILGVSSGAGLGVMAALAAAWALGGIGWLERSGAVLPAAAGALGALAIVQWLGRRREGPDPLSLVLAGAVVSAMCGAFIMLLQQLVPHGLRADLAVWMAGRIPEAVDGRLLAVGAILAAAGLALALRLGPAMDAATFGDDEAHALGLSLPRLRATLATAGGILAAAAVALAGPIAFVGLVAPHAARLLVGARHGPLALAAALAGAALLVGADCVRQLVDVGGGRLPVGVLTALAGGPVFLALLRSGRGQS